jgi:hypothetical protein
VARLAKTRIKVAIDVAFGDAIEPGLQEIDFPVLLGLPAPRLHPYAMETVIAEKFHAMVMLGRANTRMKDYYDIWMLSRIHVFEGDGLARAIAATFERRDTEIPITPPDGLSGAFGTDPAKRRQWESFSANIEATPPNLEIIIADLLAFLMPFAKAALERRT